MKALKVVLALIVVLLVLAVGAFIYLDNNINGIVKNIIESEGPKVTQTAVNVGAVNIQLRDGRGELTNLRVANPEGYESAHALEAQQLVLQVEPKSVIGDVIVIKEVVVRGVTVTAEQKGLTTNLQALLRSIREATASDRAAEKEESNLRLMVEKIRFADSGLHLITEEHGTHDLDLPALELTNIGNREQGLTPAELGRAVLQPLLAQAKETAQKRLQQRVRGEAETRLKDEARERLGDDAGERVKKLRGLLN